LGVTGPMSCLRSCLRRALQGSPTRVQFSTARLPYRAPARLFGVTCGATAAVLLQAGRHPLLQCKGPKGDSTDASKATGSDSDKALPDEVDPFVERLASLITGAALRLGSAGFMGFCAGVALKRATTEAAYALGGAFIFLQVLAWRGYVDIKWRKVYDDVVRLVDTDGDGEITRKDVLKYIKGLMSILVYKLPSTAGFTTGLYYGFYWE